MIFEKPVVASDCNPIKRILDETRAGVVFESNNEADLADKVVELQNNKKLQLEMGKKGKEAVLEKYNWNEASKNLITLYNKINTITQK